MVGGDPLSWKKVSIVSVRQFDLSALALITSVADEMRQSFEAGENRQDLAGRVLGCLFYEPSTRTSCSFQAAMQRLGGSVINVNESTSSAQKGESIEDTIRCMTCYCDAVALRHPVAGAALKASHVSHVSIINAGDGVGEHPTQALLDLYTLLREFGTDELSSALKNKKIALLGDLKHGRTVHSLAQLLASFQVELVYVAPDGLGMPQDVIDAVAEKNVAKQRRCDLADCIHELDAIYVTRIQKERFLDDYQKFQGSYRIDPETMKKAKSTCAVLHPLPRNDEIHPSFDADPRAAYFRQMQNGMFVRMALLKLLIMPSSYVV